MKTPNLYHLPEGVAETLYETSFTLPPPTDFEDENLALDTVDNYRYALRRVPGITPLITRMRSDLATERSARGYLVIGDVPTGPMHKDMTVPTALCALIGQPFILSPKNGFWQDIGVNAAAHPGAGENPMRIDAANTTNPPDYRAHYSLRTDPRGGGISLLSNVQDMVDKLTAGEVEALSQPRFMEGRSLEMRGVGHEYSPFPVLERQNNGLWMVRLTGRTLPETTNDTDKRLLRHVGRLLFEGRERFTLRPTSLLITNQHIVAHGQTPPGSGQEAVPQNQRRYLRQSYLRRDGTL